jgi:hypothetical protein
MRRPFRARRSLGLSATSQHEHAMRGPAARVAAGIDDTQESSLDTLSLFSHRFERDTTIWRRRGRHPPRLAPLAGRPWRAQC